MAEPGKTQIAQRFLMRFDGAAAAENAQTQRIGAARRIYLGGGIAPRLLPILANNTFRQHFEAKGREAALVAHIPTCVITCETATLNGAAQIMAHHRR